MQRTLAGRIEIHGTEFSGHKNDIAVLKCNLDKFVLLEEEPDLCNKRTITYV